MNIKSILKCTLFSVLLSAVLFFILAAVEYFTNISETVITPLVYGAVILSVLAASIVLAKAADNKVLIHTMVLCAVYVLILIGLSFAVNGQAVFTTHFLALMGGIFAAGVLGAVIGK